MKYQAVVFDLDGTLLDTLSDLADCMNAALKARQFPAQPIDAYRYFVGDGMLNLARRAAPRNTDEQTLAELVHAMAEIYDKNWANKTKPYDGVMPMLVEMKRRGVKMNVLSNKPDTFTQLMIKHYFPEGMFEQTFGARDNIPRKPSPVAALEIAVNLDLPPSSFLYLGDTNTDMRTGLAAGMFTIGVAWGFRPVAELLEAGAQAIIDAPGQALSFLG